MPMPTARLAATEPRFPATWRSATDAPLRKLTRKERKRCAARNDDLARLDSLRAGVVGRTVRAPWSLGHVVVLAARLAAAAQPCPDEPGLDGIACRIDGLGVRAGAASSRLAAASTACDAGHTADAIRELRGMGRPLARAGTDADVLLTDVL